LRKIFPLFCCALATAVQGSEKIVLAKQPSISVRFFLGSLLALNCRPVGDWRGSFWGTADTTAPTEQGSADPVIGGHKPGLRRGEAQKEKAPRT